MPEVGDFVRKTLALLVNCAVAIATLAGAAIALRPVRGAIRCKARRDHDSDAPDGRLVLFLGCVFCSIVCVSWASGVAGVALMLGKTAVGASTPDGSTILLAVLLYFTCEWSVTSMYPRRSAPGRKGLRNREVMRFLVALLMVQFTVYEPLASVATRWITASASRIPGELRAGVIADVIDVIRVLAIVTVLLAPLFALFRTIDRTPSLKAVDPRAQGLVRLPLNLLGAALASELISAALFAPATPKIAAIGCAAKPTSKGTDITIDVLLVNTSDRWWKPASAVKLALLDTLDPTDPRLREDRLLRISDSWSETGILGGPNAILLKPHAEARLAGHVAFDEEVTSSAALSCALITGHRPLGLLDVFQPALPQEDLLWREVTPSSTMEQSLDSSAMPEENSQPTSGN